MTQLYTHQDFMKQCPSYDVIPTIIPPQARIIVIGDIHGDIKLAIDCFKIAKLIDNNMKWIAQPPNTVVVQVGDQIDSCRPTAGEDCHDIILPDDFASDITVIDFFDKMHMIAKQYGGAVYSLLGNHEIMNIDGDFRYVSRENYESFKYVDSTNHVWSGPNGRTNAFKPGGPLSKHIACTRPSVLIVGSTMFAHAGVLPLLVEKMDHLKIDNATKLKYINDVVRTWILHMGKNKLTSTIVDDQSTSVFWNRVYGKIPIGAKLSDQACNESVDKILKTFKIGKLVVGHTPQTSLDGINGTCSDTLYRVDGGFSKAFSQFQKNTHKVQVLEISNDNIFNIISD